MVVYQVLLPAQVRNMALELADFAGDEAEDDPTQANELGHLALSLLRFLPPVELAVLSLALQNKHVIL